MARRTDRTKRKRRRPGISFPFRGSGKKRSAPDTGSKKSGSLGRIAFTVLITLAILALAFFLVMRDQGNISLSENTVGSIFEPVQNAVSSATRYIRDVIQGAKNYAQLTEDYELAKHEIDSLKMQLQVYEEDALENERLRTLLDAKQRNESMNPVYASVIARNTGVWMDTFTINRGTRDGVEVDMAVVTGDGLVGRVLETGYNYAKVMSIVDTRSSVSCLIERTRESGVMRGQITNESETQECYMYYLPSVNNIAPGDVVLTAGDDSVFPKGLKVGTVASISRQSGMSDQYIVVLPSVDFLHIEEVLVLRTKVQDEQETLEALATPAPTPTPEATPSPDKPSEENEEQIDPDDQIWQYPTPMPENSQTDDMTEATPTPVPTLDPNGPPEDAWTR